MATIDSIRNNLIDKLLTITNKDFIAALDKLVEKSSMDQDLHYLTEEQKLMLKLSEQDIKKGRLITNEEVNSEIEKWLNEK